MVILNGEIQWYRIYKLRVTNYDYDYDTSFKRWPHIENIWQGCEVVKHLWLKRIKIWNYIKNIKSVRLLKSVILFIIND
jgi:hypothetical protein